MEFENAVERGAEMEFGKGVQVVNADLEKKGGA